MEKEDELVGTPEYDLKHSRGTRWLVGWLLFRLFNK